MLTAYQELYKYRFLNILFHIKRQTSQDMPTVEGPQGTLGKGNMAIYFMRGLTLIWLMGIFHDWQLNLLMGNKGENIFFFMNQGNKYPPREALTVNL